MSANSMLVQNEPVRLSGAQMAHIAVARLYARVGWPGCIGCLMLLVSAFALIWLRQEGLHVLKQHRQAMQSATVASSPSVSEPAPASLRTLPPTLPRGIDSVALLKRIKSTVQAGGLTWPQADYRLTPLSDERLATLEIRTTLKGPYPKLRQLISTLLDKEPALALQELSLTRPNGDTLDVEAKVRWVVFLADGWAQAEAGGSR